MDAPTRVEGEVIAVEGQVEEEPGRVDRAAREGLGVEARIAKLCGRFLGLDAASIESEIPHALAEAAGIAGADRSFLAVFSSDPKVERRTYEWRAPDVPPAAIRSPERERRCYRGVRRALVAGEVVRVSRRSELGPDEAALQADLSDQGILSYLAIPVQSGTDILGVLGFHCLSDENPWPEERIAVLRLVGELLTGAFRRLATENALRASEARFRAIAENAREAICEIDAEGKVLYANPSFERIAGKPADALGSLDTLPPIHPGDRESLESARQAFARGHSGTVLYRARHSDGSWRWYEANGSSFVGPDATTRWTAVIRDVTRRQESQEALARRLELETQIAELSRGLLDRSGDDFEEAIGEALGAVARLAGADRCWGTATVHGAEAPMTFAWVEDGDPASVRCPDHPLDTPYTARRIASGEVIHVADVASLPPEAELERRLLESRGVRSFLGIPMQSGGEPIGFLGFERSSDGGGWSEETIRLLRLTGDVLMSAIRRRGAETALRDSERRLLQSQKLEAVGTLAGGIAHDFNNQLSVILGNASFLASLVSEDRDGVDAVEDLTRSAEHCAQLTRSLLAFSRNTHIEPTLVPIDLVLREMRDLLHPLVPASIAFEVVDDSGDAAVLADPTQLQQVLVNLAVNARDAMPLGGRLRIRAQVRELDEAEAARDGLPAPGRYIELAVEDQGLGMDDATVARIFEPFFTTKGPGKGTGLGLATVYGIVRSSNGTIGVETRLGVGTTFRVLLPVVEWNVETKTQLAGASA